MTSLALAADDQPCAHGAGSPQNGVAPSWPSLSLSPWALDFCATTFDMPRGSAQQFDRSLTMMGSTRQPPVGAGFIAGNTGLARGPRRDVPCWHPAQKSSTVGDGRHA